jgi:sugar O-acyltransferase (sialic acid O-acetyltransferase NeuD family)
MEHNNIILIGYSGHAYVAHGILTAAGKKITGYCDREEKAYNPFHLHYYGAENNEAALDAFTHNGCFIAIGDNGIRQRIYQMLTPQNFWPVNAIHPSAVIDPSVVVATNCVMIAGRAVINPLATIGTGAICNTGCIIEHECEVGAFAHIGPGAVLCGNVYVGEGSFVGAGAVVRQGITIGSNVMIGAGAVVVKDVPDNAVVMGNPARGRE